ncbi:acyl-CoA thioester hydrolase/BAAT C-terminal domain-containing protein [Amycolatopsis cihanbeyliensis]|uniref:acyl-CoA thioester hydrolase/BAAT C-terminal domain-containing protein n=1 Tax=Amycolatopsis cihanbeyliensis TaxID=1128664 RepID=UPI0011529375|nr:acyl-CoA thioester hydrolase/BAAT C-terminal domain-containing protein [Amycolatopsis cihanbeyliensis]
MSIEVKVRQVHEDGLVGTLCTPVDAVTAPGVLLLGGSEGGLHERDARMLAAEGFTVLALAYFGGPGLPSGLVRVPLEYFFRALDFLAEQSPDGERFGVLGGSRGAEAGLLVAAHDRRVGAVVGVVGGGVVTQGIDHRHGDLLEILATPAAPWTLHAEPLPYLPYLVSEELRARVRSGQPVPLTLAFRPPPEDPVELERVSIPVERIRGPVLLLSAGDDRMWPGAAYCEVAMNRLTTAGHPYAFRHRVFAGAGHGIAGPPGEPLTGTTSPGPGVRFELGGTPATGTEARARAWAESVEFLATALR